MATKKTPRKKPSGKRQHERLGLKLKSGRLVAHPDQLVLVTDPSDPLYDRRATVLGSAQEYEHPEVDLPGLCHSLITTGQKTPITIFQRAGELVVVDGRLRLQAIRMAMRADDNFWRSDLIDVWVAEHRGDLESAVVAMVVMNFQRWAEGLLGTVDKVSRLARLGMSNIKLADIFGLSEATIRNYRILARLPTDLLEEVGAGRLAVRTALALESCRDPARIWRAIQGAHITKVVDQEAAVRAFRDHEELPAWRERPEPAPMRQRAFLAELHTRAAATQLEVPVAPFLRFLAGDGAEEELPQPVRALIEGAQEAVRQATEEKAKAQRERVKGASEPKALPG